MADRVWLETKFYTSLKLSDIKHYKKVLKVVENNLKEHGVQEYYILISSPKTYRFAELFGFEFNFETVEGHRELEIMKKVIK